MIENCEKCNILCENINEIWEIFHGYNSYCSIIGPGCYQIDHHVHYICTACDKNIKNSKIKWKNNNIESYEHARQFSYDRLTYKKETYIEKQNRKFTKNNNLLREDLPRYKNSCEECGMLMNSRTQKWLYFMYPISICNNWMNGYCKYGDSCKFRHHNIKRNCILSCKNCFETLADEYFK